LAANKGRLVLRTLDSLLLTHLYSTAHAPVENRTQFATKCEVAQWHMCREQCC